MIARTCGDVERTSVIVRTRFAESSRRMSSRHSASNALRVVPVQSGRLPRQSPPVSAPRWRGGGDLEYRGVVVTAARATRVSRNPRHVEAAAVPLLGLVLAFPSRMGTLTFSVGLRFNVLSEGFEAVTQAAHRELRSTGETLADLSKRSAVMSDYE